ncbi:MAG: hypothetical protein OXC37_05560 [Bdellovibrionaceae bacterium]|nr:hypothetical protein [Pseudobdellovibrionaceae bacterium]
MKLFQQKKYHSLIYIFCLFFTVGFQKAEETVDMSNVNVLNQNIMTVEQQIGELNRQIQWFRKKMDSAISQTQQLDKENNKIREVLRQNIPLRSTFPWIRLSSPQKIYLAKTGIHTMKFKTERIQNIINELINQSSDFLSDMQIVEGDHKKLSEQYKMAKKDHQRQRSAKQTGRSFGAPRPF